DCGVAGVGGWLMKALVGAVVLLAGAVWFAGGAVAEAILAAAQRSGYSGGGIIGMLVGAPVVLAGLILLGIGWKFDSAAGWGVTRASVGGPAPNKPKQQRGHGNNGRISLVSRLLGGRSAREEK